MSRSAGEQIYEEEVLADTTGWKREKKKKGRNNWDQQKGKWRRRIKIPVKTFTLSWHILRHVSIRHKRTPRELDVCCCE